MNEWFLLFIRICWIVIAMISGYHIGRWRSLKQLNELRNELIHTQDNIRKTVILSLRTLRKGIATNLTEATTLINGELESIEKAYQFQQGTGVIHKVENKP